MRHANGGNVKRLRTDRSGPIPAAPNGGSRLEHMPERLVSFAAALDEIRREVESQLGREDVAHIERMRAISERLEIVGRTLVHLSFDPFTFGVGVVALWGHKQLETTEIGHTVLHGAYDRLEGAEAFRAEGFAWKFPVDEKSWQAEHNVRHHQYTNIAGKDPDLRLGPTRLSAWSPYRWYHALQPVSSVGTWVLFGAAIHLQATGFLDLYMHQSAEPEVVRDRSPETFRAVHRATLRKLVRHYGREYVLFPALAGPFFWKVLLGNGLSDILRNIYSAATIYCGHAGTATFPPGTRARGRGEWYAMQVESSHDFEVPLPFSVLCGGLDRQIEHHLFPRLPPNRLRQIAPHVRAACEAHGVTYRTGSWPSTLWEALRSIRALAVSVQPRGTTSGEGFQPEGDPLPRGGPSSPAS